MFFSVIVPVYNVEQYLHKCLDSILEQSFLDWEAICINDGSVDGSLMILEDYNIRDSRFKVISQANGGLSSARNTGLNASQGEYVIFLDSDDWLEPNALEVIARNLKGEDVLCFSGRRFFEQEESFCQPDQLKDCSYSSGMTYYNENALLHRDFAFVCVVLRAYKRSLLFTNNLFFKEGIFHEDNLFTPQVCYFAKTIRVIDECLYDYRVRANSITTTTNPKRLSDLLGTANELAAFFVSKNDFDKTTVYRAITHHYQVVFMNASGKDLKLYKRLCNWKLYREVSRTKIRHIKNYWTNRLRLL